MAVTPAKRTEIEDLAAYVAEQLDSIRTCAYGLTEEQARLTPCRSALSIGGILKHCTFVAERWHRRLAERDSESPRPYEMDAQRFFASFALSDDETLAGTLRNFDAAAEQLSADLRDVDPSADMVEPPAPWLGRSEPVATAARFAILHQIEELARHAGHADIVREQIDGALAAELDAAVKGRPSNPYVTAWSPTATESSSSGEPPEA